jgi:hypothetical protein
MTINKIVSSHPSIRITGGDPQIPELKYTVSNEPSTLGDVRYNPNTKNLEVFDGTGWIQYAGSTAYVNLDLETTHVLTWAKCRMLEEQNIQEMAQIYPSVEDAWQNFKNAENQLRVLVKLVEKNSEEKN